MGTNENSNLKIQSMTHRFLFLKIMNSSIKWREKRFLKSRKKKQRDRKKKIVEISDEKTKAQPCNVYKIEILMYCVECVFQNLKS